MNLFRVGRALLGLPLLLALAAPLCAAGGGDECNADDCANPDVIGGVGLFPFETTAATTDGPGDPLCLAFGQDNIQNDIWCVWTAPFTGTAIVDTCEQTTLDTRIAVYRGTSCVGTILACNDDFCGFQSLVSVPVTSGEDYLIRLGSFASEQSGTGTFRIAQEGTVPDCDDDGIPDTAEEDCNFDQIPDDCQDLPDCNDNGVPDPCELCPDPQVGKGGECSEDCNHNGIPDECEPDCNENGIPDDCDLCETDLAHAVGCSEDCNQNGIPDECDPDCDGDGIPDACDEDSCEPTDLLCEEFDRFADLTPNDTLTVITSQHNPQQEQGYLWVYAVDAQGRGIGRDALIGQLLVVDGLETLQYAVNAVDYRAAVAPGALTDVDLDGVRDLDGLEYERTGGQILVPRFLGSDPQRQTRGELILVGLSGGSQFTTTADFLVYNDDEDAFSANYTFYCWDKVSTLEVSNVFSNQWLKDFSGQNPAKGLGNIEYGWFEIDGGVASSTFFSLLDPALYAVYVEKVGDTAAADLPFERCTQSGHLLPRAVSGDNSETNGAPSDEDCAQRHTGRKPASLLLFPEFDNRFGVATVVTVTNTSATEDVRTHWIYVGRYGN